MSTGNFVANVIFLFGKLRLKRKKIYMIVCLDDVQYSTFILRFSNIVFAREEGLVVLSGQIHVVIRQRFFAGGPREPLVLRAAEEIQRVSPYFTLWMDGKITGVKM